MRCLWTPVLPDYFLGAFAGGGGFTGRTFPDHPSSTEPVISYIHPLTWMPGRIKG